MLNSAFAQTEVNSEVILKTFNWGFRVGFNARNSELYSIFEDGVKAENKNITNCVGFQSNIFGRINIENIFLQPEVGYNIVRESIQFNHPTPTSTEEILLAGKAQDITLNQHTQSLNSAMLLGYNIVKHDAYLFNVFLGPNFRYTFLNTFNKGKDNEYKYKTPQYNLNLIAGISANISYFYFDFRYEINIPEKKDFSFEDDDSAPDYLKNIAIRKNENLLSFSIGMMF